MNQEETINDILEIVTFMKNNMVTQTEFKELKVDVAEIKTDVSILKTDVSILKTEMKEVKQEIKQTKKEIKQTKKEMIKHVDGFIGLDRKNQSEIASIAMTQHRQGEQIKTIAKHLDLDLA